MGDIELWLVDLARSSEFLLAAEARKPRLADDDRQRLAATANAQVRAERELSWIALRLVIARAAGDDRFDGVAFERSPNGKPFLAEAPVAFSLSHSGGFALVAATATPASALGVDIQAHAALRMSAERVARMIAAGARLGGSTEPSGQIAVSDDLALTAFVRIEAVAKATGFGLAHVLARLGVLAASADHGAESDAADRRFAAALADLDVRDLEIGEVSSVRFHGAIAAMRGVLPSRLPLRLMPDDGPF